MAFSEVILLPSTNVLWSLSKTLHDFIFEQGTCEQAKKCLCVQEYRRVNIDICLSLSIPLFSQKGKKKDRWHERSNLSNKSPDLGFSQSYLYIVSILRSFSFP